MDTFTIGTLVNTQGLQGEVRVLPETFDPGRFNLLDEILVETKAGLKPLPIERVRFQKQFVILKFKGLDTIEAVQGYKGCVLKIPAEKALPLEADEYYYKDLFGLTVVTETGDALGTITDILQTGANDVYAVTGAEGKTILIPAIKQCILKVDVPGKTMTVHLLEGLVE